MIQFEVITDGAKTLNQINQRYENDFKQYVGSDCEIEIQVLSFEEFQGAYFAKFLGLVKTDSHRLIARVFHFKWFNIDEIYVAFSIWITLVSNQLK